MHRSLMRFLIVAACILLTSGCPRTSSVQPAAPNVAPSAERTAPPEPEPPQVPEEYADQVDANENEWLFVETLRDGAEGAWATGRFIPEANKIAVETDGVERFAIHLDRIDFDRTRRVVLRIDGSNAELVSHDEPVLHFRRSAGGSWDLAKD